MAAKKIREILEDQGLPENPTIDIQNDEFRGMGGSYIIDPATGKRIRIAGPGVGADSIRPEIEPATEQPETETVNNEGQ